jgi:CRISPR-associated protein Cas2
MSAKPKRKRRERRLSGYRLMWVMVLFDLPVDTAEGRTNAAKFREHLLSLGFERCQFSVYLRFAEGREQAETWTRKIGVEVPERGKVDILYFTDKQYESIVRFDAGRTKALKNPGQYQLF